MNFDGMRAVVIDDKPEEVKKLFLALDGKGISYNYYSNRKNFPKSHLEGVRLVFLDLELGFSSDVEIKNKVAIIQDYLDKIISQNNGPYILIIWANDQVNFDCGEILDLLKERLPQTHKSLPFLIIDDFNKSEIKDDARKIIKKIEEKIKLDKIVNLLFQWEKFGHEALNETLREFVGEVPSGKNLTTFIEDLDEKLKRDFRKFLELELGSNIPEGKSILCIPQFLLNDFFKEKSDSLIASFRDYPPDLINQIRDFSDLKYSIVEKAAINSLFSLNFNGIFNEPKPGNIYDFQQILGNEDQEFDCVNSLKKDLLGKYMNSPKNMGDEFYNESKIIALELTPDCDFSQGHWKNVRFLLGVLIPYKYLRFFKGYKKNGSISQNSLSDAQYKPLLIQDDNKDIYYISFDSIYFKTLERKKIELIKPLFVLRKQFFSDVQHWFAKHASRPGKIEFN